MENRKENKNSLFAKSIFLIFLMCCATAMAWNLIIDQKTNNDVPCSAENEAVPISAETSTVSAAEKEFALLRMERSRARDEELMLLEDMIADSSSSPQTIEAAQQRRMETAAEAENEISAEALLKARGYGETIVMLTETGAAVIVNKDITPNDAAVIADSVHQISGCGFANVVIVNNENI